LQKQKTANSQPGSPLASGTLCDIAPLLRAGFVDGAVDCPQFVAARNEKSEITFGIRNLLIMDVPLFRPYFAVAVGKSCKDATLIHDTC
jgi:hypothetical protein